MTPTERMTELYRALYAPPMTADDLALHESLVAREVARTEAHRADDAKIRDCLDFAKTYGLSGTPKYRAEALRCLEVAAAIIRGNP